MRSDSAGEVVFGMLQLNYGDANLRMHLGLDLNGS